MRCNLFFESITLKFLYKATNNDDVTRKSGLIRSLQNRITNTFTNYTTSESYTTPIFVTITRVKKNQDLKRAPVLNLRPIVMRISENIAT